MLLESHRCQLPEGAGHHGVNMLQILSSEGVLQVQHPLVEGLTQRKVKLKEKNKGVFIWLPPNPIPVPSIPTACTNNEGLQVKVMATHDNVNRADFPRLVCSNCVSTGEDETNFCHVN